MNVFFKPIDVYLKGILGFLVVFVFCSTCCASNVAIYIYFFGSSDLTPGSEASMLEHYRRKFKDSSLVEEVKLVSAKSSAELLQKLNDLEIKPSQRISKIIIDSHGMYNGYGNYASQSEFTLSGDDFLRFSVPRELGEKEPLIDPHQSVKDLNRDLLEIFDKIRVHVSDHADVLCQSCSITNRDKSVSILEAQTLGSVFNIKNGSVYMSYDLTQMDLFQKIKTPFWKSRNTSEAVGVGVLQVIVPLAILSDIVFMQSVTMLITVAIITGIIYVFTNGYFSINRGHVVRFKNGEPRSINRVSMPDFSRKFFRETSMKSLSCSMFL